MTLSDTTMLDPDAPIDIDEWFDNTLRKPNGEPYRRRAKQLIIKKYKLPVIKIGWARLIVPSAANARLAALAEHQQQEEQAPVRRGPGRPRLYP